MPWPTAFHAAVTREQSVENLPGDAGAPGVCLAKLHPVGRRDMGGPSVPPPKKPGGSRRARSARARKVREPAVVAAEAAPPGEEPAPEPPAATAVEPIFAARVPPPRPPVPLPSPRRAVFFDVENTSRAEHIARVLAHLELDWLHHATELVAVGNWRVIGHETARLLASRGAHLVHSAPSVGVRDWSDLRIAVAAGAWLAAARAGDLLEIVTDDQAFDAVGDVAASLGVTFRRLSYRALAGMGAAPPVEAARERPSRRRHRGSRRGGGSRPAVVAAAPNGGAPAEPHTAPHDELLAVARELIATSPERAVSIDALSNALKTRGFRRTPGSPRLVTRLRRIKELDVNRQGTVRLLEAGAEEPAAAEPSGSAPHAAQPEHAAEGAPTEGEAAAAPARRRRRRRGGRRRRGRGSAQPAATTPE